jgi:phage terminase small subunit
MGSELPKSMTSKKKENAKRRAKKRMESVVDGFRPRTWEEMETGEYIDEPKKDSPLYYKPPRNHPIFVSRWNEFLPDIVKRENFKQGHLAQLRILCDMYVEYAKLEKAIQEHGYVYETFNDKGGRSLRPRPEVQQLNRTRSEIRNYSKTLGLLLVKDKTLAHNESEEETWE